MAKNAQVIGSCEVALWGDNENDVIGCGVIYRLHVAVPERLQKLVGCSTFVRYRLSGWLNSGRELDFTANSVMGLRDQCVDENIHFGFDSAKV